MSAAVDGRPRPSVLGDFLGDRPLPALPEIHRGERTGHGPGARAAAWLLELARVRVEARVEKRTGRPLRTAVVELALDGAEALTPEVLALACRGWAKTTTRDGLVRLVRDGHLERTGPGVYALTAAGLAQGPAGGALLPLNEPTAASASARRTLTTQEGEP